MLHRLALLAPSPTMRAIVSLCILLTGGALEIPCALAAPPSNKSQIRTTPVLSHQPLPNDKLPPPGTLMNLSFTLSGLKKFDLRLQIFLVVDGKFLEVWIPRSIGDVRERPVFEAKIPAPINHLSYEALLYDDGNVIASTPRYEVTRPCRLLMDTEELGSIRDNDVVTMARAARILERQITLQEQTLVFLEELVSMIGYEKDSGGESAKTK